MGQVLTDYRCKRAVIVATGRSSRMYAASSGLPKGLLPLGDTTVLGRSIAQLRECGISQLCIVVGYEKEKLIAAFGHEGIDYIYNPFFAETNNLGSLWFAKDWLEKTDDGAGFLYLHNDIVYDAGCLNLMLDRAPKGLDLLVAVGEVDDEAMKVEVTAEGKFVRSSKEIPLDKSLGEWTGIARFSQDAWPVFLQETDAVLAERHFQAYDTFTMNRISTAIEFSIVPTDSYRCMELDFPEDYQKALQDFGYA